MRLAKDWDYIKRVARARLSNNKTEKHVSQYGDAIEIIGVAGELTARRFFGLDESLHTHFDRGVDFILGGRKIDIKATPLHGGLGGNHLQWPTWKPVKSDIIILTAVNTDKHTSIVLGYVYADEIERAPVNHNRRTPCHEIPIEDLRPAWKLLV